MENALRFLPKEQVEEYVEIDKRMKPEDLVYGKHSLNIYGTVISFASMFLREVNDTNEMYKMCNEFNNEKNELNSDYLAGQDEEIDGVIENAWLVYNNQLKLLDDYMLKNKQRTSTKQIPLEKLFKPGSSLSPLSI